MSAIKQSLPTTIAEFAEACRSLSNDEIYCLFEEDIDKELQYEIYDKYHSDSPEPCRAVMEAIGIEFGIQTLIDY